MRLILLSCATWCVCSIAAPPDLITCERALQMAGEVIPTGQCAASIEPAPEEAAGTYTLKLTFRLNEHKAGTWLDCYSQPVPRLDLSGSQTQRLWVRAAQPTPYLHIKIVDPENPGANRAAIEEELLAAGKALPADTWVALDLKLPEPPERRDSISYLGFYIAGGDTRAPLNQDLTIHIGRFQYVPPKRVPWPPAPAKESIALGQLTTTPLDHRGPWTLTSGDDIQTDHTARFENGGVHFNADADGWNEYLWSVPEKLVIHPQTTCRLQFDYEVLRSAYGPAGATFYALVRAKGTIQEDVGWQRWNATAGTRGSRSITFTTHDAQDYYLIFGIRHCGEIRLNDIKLWQVGAAGGAQ